MRTKGRRRDGAMEGGDDAVDRLAKAVNDISVAGGGCSREKERGTTRNIVSGDNGEAEEENGSYLSKGPARRRDQEATKKAGGRSAAAGPYRRRRSSDANPREADGDDKEERDGAAGIFVDQAALLKGVPDLPELGGSGDRLNGVDNIFDSSPAGSGGSILVRSPGGRGFDAVDVPDLTLDIDLKRRRIGVRLPRTALSLAKHSLDPTGSRMEILLKINRRSTRVARTRAVFSRTSSEVILDQQFLPLTPFSGTGGVALMLRGVSDRDLEDAGAAVRRLTREELLKPIGPNLETRLMMVCGQSDTPFHRAQIAVLTRRLLSHADPGVRAAVTARSAFGTDALDFAAIRNRPAVCVFLAEVLYCLGADLNLADGDGGGSVVHLLARKGDQAADALKTLLGLVGAGEGRKVFSTEVRNDRSEMPIHIAARNDSYQPEVVTALWKDFPSCFATATSSGDLPLHLACQFGRDPTLVAALLHHHPEAVNARRKDGFTPLHLVASRTAGSSDPMLPALAEDAQQRLVRILLDHGASRAAEVGSGEAAFTAYDIIAAGGGREAAKELLRPPADAAGRRKRRDWRKSHSVSGSSRSSGSNSNSVETNSTNGQSSSSSTLANGDSPAGDPSVIGDGPEADAAAVEAAVIELSQHPAVQAAIEGEGSASASPAANAAAAGSEAVEIDLSLFDQ